MPCEQKIQCECGALQSKSNISKHRKTAKHLFSMECLTLKTKKPVDTPRVTYMPIESRFVDDQQFIDELYAEDLEKEIDEFFNIDITTSTEIDFGEDYDEEFQTDEDKIDEVKIDDKLQLIGYEKQIDLVEEKKPPAEIEDLKSCEATSIKFCNTCQVKIDIDDKNAYVGMLNVDETVTCYHCFYKEEDEKQVAKDNQDAKDKGFVELPNGKWVKKGKVKKDNLTHKEMTEDTLL